MTINGEDRLSDLSTWSRYAEYFKSFTEEIGIEGEPADLPRKRLTFIVPFSSVGLNLGASYFF